MAANCGKTVTKAEAPTNCTPESIVTCTAKLGVSVTYRWFPADSTAALEKNRRRNDSNSLKALPFFIGKIEGDKMEAIDPKRSNALRLPEPTKHVGKKEHDVFVYADHDLTARFRALAAEIPKLRGKKPLTDAQKKNMADFDALIAEGWADVSISMLTLSHVAPKTTLGVCIGTDSKRKFRRYPLWKITTGDNDLVLDIFETYGPLGPDDKAIFRITRQAKGKDTDKTCSLDHYSGRLTGNIWMRSTHPFTAADVDALTVENVSQAMKTALKKIYSGDLELENKTGNFLVDIPKDENNTHVVRFYWEAQYNANCKDNISGFDMRRDVPSRVHPAAYAIAARAAFETKVKQIDLSSSWRPMLGAMGHRCGLALDMNWLRTERDALHLNRDGLKQGVVKDTISQEEADAYKDMEKKRVELARAKADEHDKAATALREARVTWQTAVEEHQPELIDHFRKALIEAKPMVTQILDPWYMERNTRDNQAPLLNEQRDSLEQLHRHHLHITIQDTELA